MNLMITSVLVWEKDLEIRNQLEQNRINGEKPMEIPPNEWFPRTVDGEKNGASSYDIQGTPGRSRIKPVFSLPEKSIQEYRKPVPVCPADVCC